MVLPRKRWKSLEDLSLNRRKILAVTKQLKQLRKESLKKIQAWTGFEPITSAMPVQCSTNWAIKPNGSWSYCEFVIYPWRIMGSNPVQAWIFFRLSFRNYLSCLVTARIFLLFDLSSAVQNICFIYLYLFIHPSRVYYELTIWPAPSCLDSSVGRALHRHRRGYGFESRSSLNFFQAFFSKLLKLLSNCEDLSSIRSFICSSKYMFHIFTFIYSSFTGILRTHNMTSSQLSW